MRDHDALFVDPDALNNNSLEGDNNKLPVWCLPRPIKNNKSPAGDAEEVDSQQEGDEKDHQKIRIVAKGSAAVKVSALVRGLHTIFEWLAEWFPRVKIYILTEVFPYYAYYFFV
jgi:hypothetical protein